MIPKEQLRIGVNILHHNIIKRINTYSELYWAVTNWDREEISPIPLTEEVLLKFRFFKMPYKMSGSVVRQREKYRILMSFSGKYCLCIEGISPATYMIAEFEYVHQLQNLYFDLTNEELLLD